MSKRRTVVLVVCVVVALILAVVASLTVPKIIRARLTRLGHIGDGLTYLSR